MQGEQESAGFLGSLNRQEYDSDAGDKPHRFGLYDEGGGVYSLYLSQPRTQQILQALQPWCEENILTITSLARHPVGFLRRPSGVALGPAEQLGELSAPCEAIVFEKAPTEAEINRHLPSSLLACPQGALPEQMHAVFGIILPDPNHLILLARDKDILLHTLEQFLEPASEIPRQKPRIEGVASEEILTCIDAWAWRCATLSERNGVQKMRIDTLNNETEGQTSESIEWVAPRDGGYWRTGWSY